MTEALRLSRLCVPVCRSPVNTGPRNTKLYQGVKEKGTSRPKFGLQIAGVLADLDPPPPPNLDPPGLDGPSGFGPPGPNPLANMVPRGTQSASGFGPPSRIWTPYVIVKTHSVIRI